MKGSFSGLLKNRSDVHSESSDKICKSLTTVCHSALAEAADNFLIQFCVVSDCHLFRLLTKQAGKEIG